MTARALDFAGDLRCLAAGVAAVVLGVLAFAVLAVLSLLTPGVSGAWLILPCLVMLMGLAAVTSWLVFREGALQDPAPDTERPWW